MAASSRLECGVSPREWRHSCRGKKQGNPCQKCAPISFFQKEIAAPGERKTFFIYFCVRPTSAGKPEYDTPCVARYGRSRINFRLHVGLGNLQQNSSSYGALAPRAPAAMSGGRFLRRNAARGLAAGAPKKQPFCRTQRDPTWRRKAFRSPASRAT